MFDEFWSEGTGSEDDDDARLNCDVEMFLGTPELISGIRWTKPFESLKIQCQID